MKPTDKTASHDKDAHNAGRSAQSDGLCSVGFDGDTLMTRVDDDVDFCRELVGGFLADAPVQIARLQAALAAEDLVTLRRSLHTFKGVAANLEAGELRKIAAEIEHCLEEKNQAQARALLNGLHEALTRFVRDVRNYFAEQDRVKLGSLLTPRRDIDGRAT